MEEETNQKQPRFANLQVGPTEIIYLSGLLLLFIGLALIAGIGVALTTSGGVLILTAIFNGWMMGRDHAV